MWVAVSKDPRLGNAELDAWLPDPSCCIQWDYLLGYVADYLEGTAFFIEREYIDRHYTDEYLTHYARQFVAPAARTRRLHFFRGHLGALREALPDGDDCAPDRADHPEVVRSPQASDRFEQTEGFLREHYLGFVVLRPLEHAPIGRTLLRAPVENSERHYSVPRIQAEVHLGPFRLSTEGVPFQSQDQVVGACASVALWSALAVAARHHGGRSPTPGEVTRAAQRVVRHASPGLDVSQAISAIESFGYSVEVFRPADFPGAHHDFVRMLLCHLRSQTPVMLWLDGTPAHAVIATGFRHTEQLDGPLTVSSCG